MDMIEMKIGKPLNSVVVVVISSECTWRHLGTYCFNEQFRANRNRFDLCVTFNGDVSEALSFISQLNPEFLLRRPNQGMDPAALDVTLKSLPGYEYYIVLHDDHWFHSRGWFNYLTGLLQADTGADAYGNLVTCGSYKTDIFDTFFDLVSNIIMDDDRYHANMFPSYLQGMAGIFRGRAIQKLIERDGVPHTHHNNKKNAEVCERLFSYVLLDERMTLKQIPPGYELYLRHRDHNQVLVESMARRC